MSRQLARTILDQFNARPALVAARYASVPDLRDVRNAGLLVDIQELANADLTAQEQKVTFQRAELAAAYGVLDDAEKPFVFSQGVAIIPVHGMLINRFSYSWGFVTGYNFIRTQVAAALADPDVAGIVYDVNTYGGTVAGCQETADVVYAASKKGGGKPSLAVVDSNCYSAGYYLMSAVDHIAVTPTGGVGSIGVMMMHVDMSKMLDEIGIKMTLLFAGAHKVDGHPYAPLPEDVSADMQAELEKMYDKFVATVAAHRPSLTEEAVRDTQARCYLADDALALGLIDSVQTPPEALETYFSDDETEETEPEVIMPDDVTDDDETGTEVEDDTDPDEDDPKHATEGTDPMAATTTTAPAVQTTIAAPAVDAAAVANDARSAERARVQGIVGHAEAEGRKELAEHFAFNTDMSIEAAVAALKVSPKAAAPKTAPAATGKGGKESPFLAAMDKSAHPNVGQNEDVTDNDDPHAKQMTDAQRILAAQRKAFGARNENGPKSPQQMLNEGRATLALRA